MDLVQVDGMNVLQIDLIMTAAIAGLLLVLGYWVRKKYQFSNACVFRRL
ncbi:hypothetical protein ACWOA0_06410 [Ignavigranum ruoffiae]